LIGDARAFMRVASLRPSRLPGGESAIHEPWRYALALLAEVVGPEEAKKIAATLWPQFRALFGPVLSISGASPVTTSCGRLFDGFAALLNLCPVASYDGQAAMSLENAAEGDGISSFDIEDEGGFIFLDWRGAVRSLLGSFSSQGLGAGAQAAAFHRGLARAVTEVCVLLGEKTGLRCAALSGGVWQNRLLLDLTCRELRDRGFDVLTHRALSPNDEGVSVGQAVVADCLFEEVGL
jgi:hydrogenase maturation protein HypF